MCNFLCLNNSVLPPILHRYQDMADYWSNICRKEGVPIFNTTLGGTPKFRIAKMAPKN